ncbi:SDR family NAD(P)-dependent oxidoreductase [Rhizobium rhizogenes]|uniref:SDR family NAD(P)-dependent oxidoreductase n=1 Tax=Rhizobium rhizogenes TaxID=359 RepID=UPI0015719CA5|nr:glucose 1-dehydrogenase [Rhizobium rhizogenes]NTF44602.1 glucose 1-dehydrogenase [Rhizobium rhizogenes]
MPSPIVLITGALTGIGRATALAFAEEGASIVVSGRRDQLGHELVDELRGLGAEAEYIRADVRRDDEVRTLVDQTVSRFGRLDVAVNNAGTEGTFGPVSTQTEENYAATFDTNVLGTLLSMKHELRIMQAQGSGNIINVSSVLGKIGTANGSVYVASKHAVEGLTKSAALEVATAGIRVNAVAPGPIDTGFVDRVTGGSQERMDYMKAYVPMRRLGQSEEVAAAILFLASPKAAFLTGHSLAIDGGKLAG